MTYAIAAIPGDGIGIEVVNASLPILTDIGKKYGFEVKITEYDWGSHRHIEKGSAMPDGALEELESYDAILHGATGHPDVPDTVGAHELVIPIRKEFDHYVNIRPAYLFKGADSPLKGYEDGEIDIHWYRENTEGEYTDMGGDLYRGGQKELSVQTGVWTREGVERIARTAFEAAQERDGKLTSITKSNAQRFGPVLWDDVLQEVRQSYPDVTFERMLVDAAAQHFVLRPEEFDVVVASNLFSDIHTDLIAAVTGGLGLMPSANVNPENDTPGMFEPVHGSAPDIAGRGIANPIAEILSISLLLDDVGEPEPADAIWTAVADNLIDEDAPRTEDLGGDATTADVVADIRDRL
jgi:tartrate dehydrogenase/decarboxylase/D-malate dehydrogenase